MDLDTVATEFEMKERFNMIASSHIRICSDLILIVVFLSRSSVIVVVAVLSLPGAVRQALTKKWKNNRCNKYF